MILSEAQEALAGRAYRVVLSPSARKSGKRDPQDKSHRDRKNGGDDELDSNLFAGHRETRFDLPLRSEETLSH